MMLSGCALALRSPSVAELKYNPGRYQDRTVAINGVVTSSWGLPLVPFRLYKVDDGTGEMTVVSQGGRMPTKGARVRVKGRVSDVATFGGQSVGLHLEQTRISFNGGTGRTPAVMRTATAVMSSFGGVSPRHSCTAAKIASTTSRPADRAARSTTSRAAPR